MDELDDSRLGMKRPEYCLPGVFELLGVLADFRLDWSALRSQRAKVVLWIGWAKARSIEFWSVEEII